MVAMTVARDDSLTSSSVVAMKRSSDAAEMWEAAPEADGWSVTLFLSSLSSPVRSGSEGFRRDVLVLEVLQRARMDREFVVLVEIGRRELAQVRGDGDHVVLVFLHGVDQLVHDVVGHLGVG